ncbi:protein kinase [Arthrobacter gengyunqii]|uniref:Protein kinase n=1 Tax=Arthrobacter gengyunqii TaxID=2886940 RepID=A0A9X1LZ10_9MICC|nr:protein kinase [Arthrobacter gengyunqii]MCC3268239.1 protein kinase [Arthrobacter gengyunqii]UOY95646.1 protein kinase [Arthrobacter gengyunqii]
MTDSPQHPDGALLGGRYRLENQIGAGSMGTVYRARDEFLGRDVAVKVVRTAAATAEEQQQADAESKILARLNHHSLVTLLDAGTHLSGPGIQQLYLVMELVEGADLRLRLQDGPLAPRKVAQLGYDLAVGLDYMHDAGVVHRDVKPANIMLFDYRGDDARLRAKLTDFGVALIAREPQLQTGTFTGTAAYMSPEQARGHNVGTESDIYSLGLVLLQCLTGVPAYPGPALESAVARLLRAPAIPESMEAGFRVLLQAMTALEPQDRPSAHEVSLALYELAVTPRARHRMNQPLIPADEAERIAAVRRYNLLDTPPDGAFDRITALAARLFSVPVAIVSVVDTDRIWFKSHHGTDVEQIGRDPGLCASAILQDEAWVVPDARVDPRTLTNPLVAGEFGLQFYAGVPLHTRDGYNLGTLCVLDREPREFTRDEVRTLEDLAAIIMNDLEMRLENQRTLAS